MRAPLQLGRHGNDATVGRVPVEADPAGARAHRRIRQVIVGHVAQWWARWAERAVIGAFGAVHGLQNNATVRRGKTNVRLALNVLHADRLDPILRCAQALRLPAAKRLDLRGADGKAANNGAVRYKQLCRKARVKKRGRLPSGDASAMPCAEGAALQDTAVSVHRWRSVRANGRRERRSPANGIAGHKFTDHVTRRFLLCSSVLPHAPSGSMWKQSSKYKHAVPKSAKLDVRLLYIEQ